MNFLIAGIVVFFGMHLVPSLVGLRSKLISGVGEIKYKILYAVVAMIGLILIIYGKSQAEFQAIWQPPGWSAKVTPLLMIFSMILLAGADMKSNLKRFTRHPMLWGVTVWSGAHLLANGDLASIVLFGSFGAYALFDMLSANMRGAQKQEIKYPLKKDIIVLVGGLVAYAVFVLLHPYLFGVAVIK